jgi:hypothetical protein
VRELEERCRKGKHVWRLSGALPNSVLLQPSDAARGEGAELSNAVCGNQEGARRRAQAHGLERETGRGPSCQGMLLGMILLVLVSSAACWRILLNHGSGQASGVGLATAKRVFCFLRK